MHIASRFQSTPLTRGETAWRRGAYGQGGISIHSPHTRGDVDHVQSRVYRRNFNPLPSHEGRRGMIWAKRSLETISIHSPHTRGDDNVLHQPAVFDLFQSTPLTRGETRADLFRRELRRISIHSPHTRGDHIFPHAGRGAAFQSTPLMRGETVQTAFGVNYIEFQSTPLIRGETQQQHPRRDRQPISIRSPHTRGDA